MSQGEKTLFRIGRFVVVFALGLWMWILLPIAAWYVKRIPDRTKNLPFSGWLRTNMLQDKGGKYVFYDWLSGFLRGWWVSSFLFTVGIVIVLAILTALVVLSLPFTRVFAENPITIIAILYLISVVSFGYIGFAFAKSSSWDYLIWQAEPAARALLGQEYDKLTEQQKKELHRHIADVEAGINKGTWVILDGKAVLVHVPADSFAKFGGPGVLVVPEGYIVVTERGGRIARMVGAGYYQLAQYERPQMVVYLPARAERILVNNALTRDKMVITSLELMVFHRADRGDQSGISGQYRFDEKLILEKIWSPKGGDWRDTVKAISDQSARDVIAQYDFEDLVAISGDARRKLLGEFAERINRITKDFLGVDVIAANMGAITISDEAKKVLEAKNLAEARRRTLATETEGEAAASIAKAEADYHSRIARAEANKIARMAEGEGEAYALRAREIAKAEGAAEKLRQVSAVKAQGFLDSESFSGLLKYVFGEEFYRTMVEFQSRQIRPARAGSTESSQQAIAQETPQSEPESEQD